MAAVNGFGIQRPRKRWFALINRKLALPLQFRDAGAGVSKDELRMNGRKKQFLILA